VAPVPLWLIRYFLALALSRLFRLLITAHRLLIPFARYVPCALRFASVAADRIDS
jgi:hypothetical protein